MTAEGRHEAILWGEGVSYPMPARAFLIEDGFLVEDALDEGEARLDDAYWARVAKRPWVGPMGFLKWWIARRWVMPRDIRKQ